MGFLDRIFGKSEKNRNLDRSDIETTNQILKNKIDEETEFFKKEMETFYSNMKTDSKNLEERLLILQNATCAEKVDAQLLSIADTSKKTFRDKMKKVLNVLDSETPRDMDSAFNFY